MVGSLFRKSRLKDLLLVRIFGGVGLWLSLILPFAIWFSQFPSKKLQVFSGVVCFQVLLLATASNQLRIFLWLSKYLRASLIVQWISTIYLTQVTFLVLQIPESRLAARLLVTYLCNSIGLLLAINQLPSRRVKALCGDQFWSSLRSGSLLAALLSSLTLIFLQSSILFQDLDRQSQYHKTNLNWIFLENSVFIKLSLLFVFQAVAYHAASSETPLTVPPPSPIFRRFG